MSFAIGVLCRLQVITQYTEKHAYLFTLFFSLKESFFKAVYPALGFYFDFDAVSIVDVDLNNKNLIFKVNYSLSDKFCEGKVFKGDFVHINNDTVLTLFTLQ